MIRPAIIEDLEPVIEIYNHAVDAKFQTGYTTRLNAHEKKAWLREHIDTPFPILVHSEEGVITGWFGLAPYRGDREAFRHTVEVSYYIHKDYQQQGIGRLLMAYGLNVCRELGYKTAVGVIIHRNVPSYKLAEKFGFERWGVLHDVADFDGELCDHYYYGLKL